MRQPGKRGDGYQVEAASASAGGDQYFINRPHGVCHCVGGSTRWPPRVTAAVGLPLGRRLVGFRRLAHLPPARRSSQLGRRTPPHNVPERGRRGVATDAARSSQGGAGRRRQGKGSGAVDSIGCTSWRRASQDQRLCGEGVVAWQTASSVVPVGGGALQLTVWTHVSLPAGSGSVDGRQKQ